MPVARIAPIAALGAAALAGGCGNATAGPPARRATQVADRDSGVRPQTRAPTLVRVDIIGLGIGTHDTLTFAVDGTATIIKAYGGGGYVTERCVLDRHTDRAIRAVARTLPVDDLPPKVRHHRPKSFYVPHTSFVITHRGHVDSFTADAIPADGAPIARLSRAVLFGRGGPCRRIVQRFHAG